MGPLGKLLLFGGLAIAVLGQIYIIVLALKVRASAGLFCLLVTPFYALVSDLRRIPRVRRASRVWLAGLALVVLGTIALSVAY